MRCSTTRQVAQDGSAELGAGQFGRRHGVVELHATPHEAALSDRRQ